LAKTADVPETAVPSKHIEFLKSMVQYREFDDELDNDYLYSELYCFFKNWNSHCEYFQERWCGRADGVSA
jgi:hypothetical protein